MTDRTVHLSWLSLPRFEAYFDEFEARLSADERQRSTRFRVASARHRFVLARTLLRRRLGDSLNVNPTALVFANGERGKPHMVTPDLARPPHFNLSHSGDVVVLAVSPTEVGVDVESMREVANAERLARRFFSPAEHKIVHGLKVADRGHAFLRIWTQKEAYLKATGLGVGMPLREVETESDPEAPPRLLAIAGDRDEAGRWTLLEAEVPGAVCIVAARGQMPTLEVRRFTPADLDAR